MNIGYARVSTGLQNLQKKMKTCFFNSGFKFKNFKVLDNRNAKEKSELISEAEVVILAGGHVLTQNIFFNKLI